MADSDLEKRLKDKSARFNLADAFDKKAAKDPENPDNIFNYFHEIDPGFNQYDKRSDVPEEFWAEYSGLQFRTDLKNHRDTAESELIDLVKADYKAALKIVDNKRAYLILDSLTPVDLKDPYKDITEAHVKYKIIHDLLENPELDEQIKIDVYINKILEAKGEVAKLVRRFYMRRGAIDQRLAQLIGEKQIALYKKFADANGNIDSEKIKDYVTAVVENTPQDNRNSAYAAIGKAVA